jgi:mono/diheme cytochrome c family protein
MNPETPRASARDTSTTPTHCLLAAALSGLLGIGIAGCSNDVKANADSTGATGGAGGADGGSSASGGESAAGGGAPADSGIAEVYNNLLTADAGGMSMVEFQKLCDTRGGYVYRNAACAGGSMCKGLSWHGGSLWDHSCRGQNSSCAGVGCLALPADTGLTGKEIYEDGPCAGCHADWSKVVDVDKDKPDYGKFALYYDPLTLTDAEVTKRFKDSTEERLTSSVVWGVQGFYTDYVPYSNMPAYYQKYSMAEIRRVVDYVKTLTTFTYPTEQFGLTPGYGAPEAGVEGGPPVKDAGGD